MADIMDYIDWRGDIGFDEVHVNEVDGLIFSQLIYVQMKPYMPDAKKSYDKTAFKPLLRGPQ